MSKPKAKSAKKKRNKRYSGADASSSGPKITRIKAEPKSALKQFWDEKKKAYLARVAFVGVVVLISWLLFALISWIF